MAGGPFFDVVYIMTTMIEVGSVIAVGYEDVNKTMIEVGWIFMVGYEDLKKTAGHFSKY